MIIPGISSSVSWDDVTGKPTEFIASAHTHVISDITNLQSTLDSKVESSSVKRTETYLGTTDVNGNYTVVYAVPYTVTPDVQTRAQAGGFNRLVRLTATSTTGFTVQVAERETAVITGFEVLLASTTPSNAASVGVLVTQR